jgi:hypothetical protein
MLRYAGSVICKCLVNFAELNCFALNFRIADDSLAAADLVCLQIGPT